MNSEKPDILVVSPGVPLSLNWIQAFVRAGGKIESEISLAAKYFDSEKIIGVTGSMGKSTICALLDSGIRAAGHSCFLGGNFGTPLADYALEVVDGNRERAEFIILELSSFQLENAFALNLDLALISALTPNHMERYETLEHYYETKWSISERTESPLIINAASTTLLKFAASHADSSDYHVISPEKEAKFQSAKILGKHNHQNLSFVAQVLDQLGIKGYESGLINFSGLPHRLERVGEFSERLYVNDSKATNIESIETAVTSLDSCSRSIVLLLGGRDKRLPWENLTPVIPRIKKIIVFGEAREMIMGRLGLKKLGIECEQFPTLKELMRKIKSISSKGDLVLLSPGGTSLDEFSSFIERGEKFSAWARTNS